MAEEFVLTEREQAYVEQNSVQGVVDLPSLTNGANFAGIVCITELSVATSKNGKDYMTGKMRYGSKTFVFKIWDSTLVSVYKQALPELVLPKVAMVTGAVSTYMGSLDYSLSSVTFEHQNIAATQLTPAHFAPMLNSTELYQKLCDFINTEVSENWVSVLMLVMNLRENVFHGKVDAEGKRILDMLKEAWAASGNHDAVLGGLMAHVLKMLRFAKTLVEHDPFYAEHKDLIYAGIILHDIGKVQEIVDGKYTKNSFVSHRVMGVEYLAMLKPDIVAQIGEDAYYRLVSIIVGHHDQFGTPADSVWAYVVHLIDMLDTWTTMMREAVEQGKAITAPSGELVYRKGDQRLAY